jgi:hypothetical protein
VSANAPSGTVNGTSNANAIAKLPNDHVPAEYSRDMTTSFREKNQKPFSPKDSLRIILPLLPLRLL